MDERKLFLFLKRPLALVFFSMLALMFIYEFIKQVLNPSITIWESHLITIIFTSVIAVIISYFPLRSAYNEREKARVTEAALKESEAEFKNILRTAMDGFCIVGPAGSLLDVNDAFCTMTGYSRDELLTMSLADIEVKETKTDIAGHIQEIIRKGVDRFESQYQCRDGSIIDVEVSVVHSETHSRHFLVFVHDITNRKRVEKALSESEEKFRGVAERSSDLIILYDLAGKAIYVSPSVYRILGFTPGEITGKTPLDFIHPDDIGAVHEGIRKNLEGTATGNLEVRIRKKDGGFAILDITGSPVMKDEQAAGVQIVGRDITERKLAEDDLRKAFVRFRTVMNSIDALVYVVDMQSYEILFINKFGTNIWGGIEGKVCWQTIQAGQPGPCPFCTNARLVDAAGSPTGTYVWEFRNTVNGHWYDCRDSAIPWTEGRLVRMEIATDITDRKRAEENLKFSNILLSTQQEVSIDGILVVDGSGKIISFNKRFIDLWGIPPDVIASRSDEHAMQSVIDKLADPEEFISRVKYLYANRDEKSREEIALKDGRVFDRYSAPMVDNEGMYYGRVWFFRDITERKQMETALILSEQTYRSYVDNSPMGIFVADSSGKYLDVNDAALHLLGYSHEEMMSMTVLDLALFEERQQFRDQFIRTQERLKTDPSVSFELRLKKKDGSACSVILSTTRLPNNTILGFTLDITERKRTEMERDRLVSVVRHSSEFIALATIDRKIFFINEAGAEIIGINPEYAGSYDFFEFIPVHQKELIQNEVLPALMEQGHWEGDLQYRNVKTGNLVDTHALTFLIKDPVTGAPQFLANVSLDITERKRAEDALHQANKKLNMLSSITRHDILNLIMAVRGYLELSEDLVDNPELKEYMKRENEAVDAIQRQIEFTRYYQDIGVEEPKWQNMEIIVRNLTTELDLSGITVENHLSGLEVFADPLIEKVFYNLVENSLRHGEHVTIIGFSYTKTSTGLTITYRDNGAGISEADRKKLFRKGFGKHTGLGLFLSREILSITGITIQENGELGKGVNFEILVPEGGYRVPRG